MSDGQNIDSFANERTYVLEHLASTGWFAAHGEVAMTGGLTFCLEKDRLAAAGFTSYVRARTGLNELLPQPDRWEAEVVYDDRNRVDVAGYRTTAHHRAPVILVEAKLGATLGDAQISTYVRHQQKALHDAREANGALLVLLPEARMLATTSEVASDLARLNGVPSADGWFVDGAATVHVILASWTKVFDAALTQATTSREDLLQLRGACRALRGVDVAALTPAELAGHWGNRMDDFQLIIDRVTRRASADLSLKLLTWQARPDGAEGLAGGYRYIAEPKQPNMCVGMRSDGTAPPFWVRWHRRTPSFDLVEPRLRSAGYTPQRYAGHLWLPLVVPSSDGLAEGQIESLATQVVTLFHIANGST